MTGETLFERLTAACAPEWEAYTRHRFVRELGAGTLPEACFRHYLCQDYLFLMQFARAYALAAYKADRLDDMRRSVAKVSALVDTEMSLHVAYCAEWGLTEAQMAAIPEASATVAYTRYVLDRGMSGDLLDLHTALLPCIAGYAVIGSWLIDHPETRLEGNPYRRWIELYAGEDYQPVARDAIAHLDLLMERRGGSGRMESLVHTFRTATVAEIAFWDMGLNPPPR